MGAGGVEPAALIASEVRSMTLPFTLDQFLGVFEDYNLTVWPAQVLLYVLAVALAVLGYLAPARAARPIGLGLALLWAWMGAVYHLGFFRRINPAAAAFGAAFLVQAVLFAVWAMRHRPGEPGRVGGHRARVGGLLLSYALLIYPIAGWLLGHRYPASPTFGLPCPTTIATLGLLTWLSPAPPWWLLIVPLGWVAVGSSAAFVLGMPEDLGLLASGLLAVAWLRFNARSARELVLHADGPVVSGAADLHRRGH